MCGAAKRQEHTARQSRGCASGWWSRTRWTLPPVSFRTNGVWLRFRGDPGVAAAGREASQSESMAGSGIAMAGRSATEPATAKPAFSPLRKTI